MADFQTQYRLYGYKYTAPVAVNATSTHRDIYRQNQQRLFSAPRVPVHDCREDCMRAISDQTVWEAHMFSHGLRTTEQQLHDHLQGDDDDDDDEDAAVPSKLSKLLYSVGKRGCKEQEFNFPRGMGVGQHGTIFVADTKNHRIQSFNECGVFLTTFGCHGNKDGEFNEPYDVTALPDGHIAVADKKNGRIQILTKEGDFKTSFKTLNLPCFVACDEDSTIVVSTERGTIEVYDSEYRRTNCFAVPMSTGLNLCSIAISRISKNIIACDSKRRKICVFDYSGRLLHEFEPSYAEDSMAFAPTNVDVNPEGQIMISDGLNHTVTLYTDEGDLLGQLVGPTDEAGAPQAIKYGPGGHLVLVDCTANGPHHLKIFRYKCECHRRKRRTSKTPRT